MRLLRRGMRKWLWWLAKGCFDASFWWHLLWEPQRLCVNVCVCGENEHSDQRRESRVLFPFNFPLSWVLLPTGEYRVMRFYAIPARVFASCSRHPARVAVPKPLAKRKKRKKKRRIQFHEGLMFKSRAARAVDSGLLFLPSFFFVFPLWEPCLATLHAVGRASYQVHGSLTSQSLGTSTCIRPEGSRAATCASGSSFRCA